MQNVILPLRFSLIPLTWLVLIHAGALLCLQPIAMPVALRLTLCLAIFLSFGLHCRKQARLKGFRQLQWRTDSQSWYLSDATGEHEITLRLRPGCWLTEHFLWLSFSALEWSTRVSLLFAFDQYTAQELKQLRRAVLSQHRSITKD